MEASFYDYELFLIHAPADRPWVEGFLKPGLELPAGCVITPNDFKFGEFIPAEFERAVTRSRITLLVLTPAYLADEWGIYGELLAGFAGRGENRERLVPLLLKPCEVPLRVDSRFRLDFTDPQSWQTELAKLRQFLGVSEPPEPEIACPYPGLRPFGETEAGCFFGRGKEIDELALRLRYQNFLYVIGHSGSGKSSLVFAGLVPFLQRKYPGEWTVRSLRPGAAPMQALSAAAGDLIDLTNFKVSGLNSPHLLLVVDQMEELFAQAAKDEQQLFIAALKSLQTISGLALILTLRSDFYDAWTDSPLWPVDAAQRLELGPLRGDALRSAIQSPALAVGVYLEGELVERLVADAAGEPGALPLLQETLALLWEKRQHRFLTLHAYEQLGSSSRSGLAAVLAAKADAVLAGFSSAEQTLARRIFIRLVQFSEGRKHTRRQQPISALRSAAGDQSMFEKVLHTLAVERLLTLGGEEHTTETVDLAHEILIEAWPRLNNWLGDYKLTEQTRRRFLERAADWVDRDRKGSFLDRLDVLDAIHWQSTAEAQALGIEPELGEYIQASLKHVRKEQRARWQRPLIVVGALFLLLLIGWGANMLWLSNRAKSLSPMALVQGGLAVIGTNDLGYNELFSPAWQVTMQDYWMDLHEVTNAQYCLCEKSNRCRRPAGYSSCASSVAKLPVTKVNVIQAAEYCSWIGRRLPTEIEWEWAASGPDNLLYPTSNDKDEAKNHNPFSSAPWPVDDSQISSDISWSGIQGLTGNVSEWTISPGLRYQNPQYKDLLWPYPDNDILLIIRGSNFQDTIDLALNFARKPSSYDDDNENLGFRCMKGLPLEAVKAEVLAKQTFIQPVP